MTQEDKRYLQDKLCHERDKELLLKDLCARLPYDVKVTTSSMESPLTVLSINTNGVTWVKRDTGYPFEIDWENCKPYLFPLSSMTEEQLKDVKAALHKELIDIYENGLEERKVPEYPQTWYYVQDWYNSHHFDYRGLIEKGLAIDATGLNIY